MVHPDATEHTLVVTDGRALYPVNVLGSGDGALFLFDGMLPPEGRDLWVVNGIEKALSAEDTHADQNAMICFTTGTRIRTPLGARAVETLVPGDLVQTRDNGAQPIIWAGSRRVGSRELRMVRELRPIRIRAGALGTGEPDSELLVSPRHRMLLRGDAARDLFGESEVLVEAEDLIDDVNILTCNRCRTFRYHHLMLESHQVLWANELPSESFHPADFNLGRLDDLQRLRFIESVPAIYARPGDYGVHARRVLNRAEAAILSHARH
ncbi:MAG: Hint domain-containing protein [Pseudomonadota bacterium]